MCKSEESTHEMKSVGQDTETWTLNHETFLLEVVLGKSNDI